VYALECIAVKTSRDRCVGPPRAPRMAWAGGRRGPPAEAGDGSGRGV